jgi:hypothetical protein
MNTLCAREMLPSRKGSTLIQRNGLKKEKEVIKKAWHDREFMA